MGQCLSCAREESTGGVFPQAKQPYGTTMSMSTPGAFPRQKTQARKSVQRSIEKRRNRNRNHRLSVKVERPNHLVDNDNNNDNNNNNEYDTEEELHGESWPWMVSPLTQGTEMTQTPGSTSTWASRGGGGGGGASGDGDMPSDEESLARSSSRRVGRETRSSPGFIKSQDTIIFDPTKPNSTMVSPDGSVHPQQLAQFQKLKMQAEMAVSNDKHNEKVDKVEERKQEVRAYRQLWKQYKDIQEQVAVSGGRPKVKRSKSFDLKDIESWYFDFASREVGFDPQQRIDDDDLDYDLSQGQANLSLLSETSMDAQRRLYAEKRRARQRKGNKTNRSASIVDSTPLTNNISLRGNSKLDRSTLSANLSLSMETRSLTNMEVAFDSPKHRSNDGQDGNESIVSDLGDDNSASAASLDVDFIRRIRRNARKAAAQEAALNAAEAAKPPIYPPSSIAPQEQLRVVGVVEAETEETSPLPRAMVLMDKFDRASPSHDTQTQASAASSATTPAKNHTSMDVGESQSESKVPAVDTKQPESQPSQKSYRAKVNLLEVAPLDEPEFKKVILRPVPKARRSEPIQEAKPATPVAKQTIEQSEPKSTPVATTVPSPVKKQSPAYTTPKQRIKNRAKFRMSKVQQEAVTKYPSVYSMSKEDFFNSYAEIANPLVQATSEQKIGVTQQPSQEKSFTHDLTTMVETPENEAGDDNDNESHSDEDDYFASMNPKRKVSLSGLRGHGDDSQWNRGLQLADTVANQVQEVLTKYREDQPAIAHVPVPVTPDDM